MTEYLFMNVVALLIAVLFALRLKNWRQIQSALKIALLATILAYPWLYFGIAQHAWGHGDPGPVLFGVPLNELILAFIMTFANASALLAVVGSVLQRPARGAETEKRPAE